MNTIAFRLWRFAVVALTLTLAVTACGSDDGDTGQPEERTVPASTEDGTTDATTTTDSDGTSNTPTPDDGESGGDDEDRGQDEENRETGGGGDGGDTVSAPAEPSVLERLVRNAEEFEYSVGEFGGVLTSATISEPLTFNLAVSADSGSSGVLRYLFEGLTRTSWAHRRGGARACGIMGAHRGRSDLDFPPPRRCAMA